MTTLLVAFFMLGLLLGMRFAVYVLLPASFLSLAADFISLGTSHLTLCNILAALFVGPLMIQVGYCVGHFCRPRNAGIRPTASFRFGTH